MNLQFSAQLPLYDPRRTVSLEQKLAELEAAVEQEANVPAQRRSDSFQPSAEQDAAAEQAFSSLPQIPPDRARAIAAYRSIMPPVKDCPVQEIPVAAPEESGPEQGLSEEASAGGESKP